VRERHDRNVKAFGRSGQEILAQLFVAVVGVGGIGTHVVQQLAYLGVGRIGLVDSEKLEVSNLNRYVGATTKDVGKPKVEIGEEMVKTIDARIAVLKVCNNLTSKEAYEIIKRADYVFGCLDSEFARMILNELCLAYERPFFDLATEIVPGDRIRYGGRVSYISDSGGCLYCLGVIDRSEASLESHDQSHREDIANLYGMDPGELGVAGPSVVSLNGIIASLGVMEFMGVATGLRPGIRLLNYYGEQDMLRISKDKGDENCYFCKRIRGQKDKADVERYI
jgi:ThiF family